MDRLDAHHQAHYQRLLSEGWQQLYQRTQQAVTHLMAMRKNAATETAAEHVAAASPDYALLPVCVQEFEQGYRVTLEIPGMHGDDFDISLVDDNLLLVRGEKRVPPALTDGQFHQLECAFGHFERRIVLPGEVDERQTRAAYRQGVLTIELTRATSRVQKRRIEVEVV